MNGIDYAHTGVNYVPSMVLLVLIVAIMWFIVSYLRVKLLSGKEKE